MFIFQMSIKYLEMKKKIASKYIDEISISI